MRHTKYFIPVFLLFFSLACSSGINLPFLASASPTPAPGLDFAVTIVYPTATPTPPLATAAPITATATVTVTATLPVTPTETVPAPTPEPPPSTAAATLTPTVTLTQPVPPPASIALLEPVEDFNLQPNINELEFKWRWAAQTSCQPPAGYGYELRIWPAVSGYGPMGVIDAVANQQSFYCNPESNVASYRVADLKGTPGVKAMSAGKFLWDVAYIQLDPYAIVYTSGSRLFTIP